MEILTSRSCRPHLLIVDLHMPVMDGWELMGHLRRHPELATIPVGIQPANQDVTLPEGVSFVLPKPIDVTALLTVVRHHCG